jgi:hypothetical protein
MNSNDPWPPHPDEVVRVLSRNPNIWMTPEKVRRGLGLPGGYSRTHQLRPTLIGLVGQGLVESRERTSRPQKGWEFRLTSKGVAHAKTI